MGANLALGFICCIIAVATLIELMKSTTKGWYGIVVLIIYAATILIGPRHMRLFGDKLEARFMH